MSSNVGFWGTADASSPDPALEVVVLELGRREIGGVEEGDRGLTEHQRADAVDVGVGEARLHDTPRFFPVERRPLLAGDLPDALPRERAAVAVLHDRGEAVVPHREHERGAGEDLGVLVEQRREAAAAAGLVDDLGPRGLDQPRVDVVHGVGILESLRRLARVLDDHDHRAVGVSEGAARVRRAQSHRSTRPGRSRLRTTRHSSSESSSTRFRMAKAPAIKSKATANATRRRAIAGRVFAGRDSTAAAGLRLRDAHRPLVGSAVPSGVAQPAEQRTVNPLVESSSLSPGARRACSSVVRAGDS